MGLTAAAVSDVGLGSAFRSTLLFAVSGKESSTMMAEGSMGRGRRVRRCSWSPATLSPSSPITYATRRLSPGVSVRTMATARSTPGASVRTASTSPSSIRWPRSFT